MTIRAALFDFSGTLFRLEHPELESNADLMRALTSPVGLADGIDPELATPGTAATSIRTCIAGCT